MQSNIAVFEYHKFVTKLVQHNLKKLIPDSSSNIIQESMRYMILDCGKMYRSFLLLATAKIFTEELKPFIDLATVIEIIHTYTLIHDDLPAMDNDDFRRGKAACHKKFDEATAILTGNALLTLAYETLASDKVKADAKLKLELIEVISKLIGGQGTVYGQCLDIKSGAKQEQRQNINLLKTANLFIAATESVSILCKIKEPERNSLREFAANFGLAYQLMDDIADQENDGNIELLTRLKNESLKKLDIFGSKALMLRQFTQFLFNK
jgi:farnesyl diphosphate synthase